jgi:peptidoglycan/LPS O-acetylase OafA/YrhL
MATATVAVAMSGGRERFLDVLRALALVRIVAYHAFGWLSTTLAAAFSFLLPAMGVMFALGGSLIAASLDRASAASVLRHRVRRLLPSLWVLGLFVVPVMFYAGWPDATAAELAFWLFPISEPGASKWGAQVVDVLWYVRAYLWFVLLSPLLLPAYRRWPVPTLLAPLALITALETGLIGLEGRAGSVLSDLGAFGTCWILGFAHRDGALAKVARPVLVGVAVTAAVLGASWAFTHPADLGDGARTLELGASGYTYDLNDIPLGNALWSIAFVLLVLSFSPSMAWLRRVPIVDRIVAVMNARALTIYLWHEIALVLVVLSMDSADWSNGTLWSYALLFACTWAVIGVFILLFGWVEDLSARRRATLLPRAPGAR